MPLFSVFHSQQTREAQILLGQQACVGKTAFRSRHKHSCPVCNSLLFTQTFEIVLEDTDADYHC
jgi:hypothetical protein